MIARQARLPAPVLREVWGPAYDTQTNHLRVYMAQLRRMLEADPAHPRHLLTQPGMGYRFVQSGLTH
jgi:two-component system KDP operon response regulator KdpE